MNVLEWLHFMFRIFVPNALVLPKISLIIWNRNDGCEIVLSLYFRQERGQLQTKALKIKFPCMRCNPCRWMYPNKYSRTIKEYYFFFFFRCRVAGHPLAQNEKCLHIFLQDAEIDKNYVPGKVRTTWIANWLKIHKQWTCTFIKRMHHQ